MNKRYFKKSKEELEDYLRLMRKHSAIPSKKGKGSYRRNTKHRGSVNG